MKQEEIQEKLSTVFSSEVIQAVDEFQGQIYVTVAPEKIREICLFLKNDPDLSADHTIAVDGSLFEKYPRFRSRMEGVFRELYGDRASRLNLILTTDGSGFGAAVIAAVASTL